MPKDSDSYSEIVADIEAGLEVYAKRSFESFSPAFVDGGEVHAFYQKEWEKTERRARLQNRTPLQVERDRILYSSSLRKETEKYHVLYNGQRRIVRNYTTHTMRM